MSPRPTYEALARLAYANGTRLLTSDFDRWIGYEPGIASGHVRCAHATWGIGEGLLVLPSGSGRQVTVTAGAAWSCRGEVLAVPGNTLLEAPPPSGSGPDRIFDLILRTPPDPEPCARPIEGCTGAAVTSRIPPPIEWIAVGDVTQPLADPAPGVRLGLDVPLGRMVFGNDGTLRSLDSSVRRHARPLRSSRLYAASTPVAVWKVDTDGSRYFDVDTSAGRFARIPVYAAWADPPDGTPLAFGPWIALETAGVRSFRIRARMGLKLFPAGLQIILPATIHWLAAEPTLGCPPPPPPPPRELPVKPADPIIL
jgi:hypothetical protein